MLKKNKSINIVKIVADASAPKVIAKESTENSLAPFTATMTNMTGLQINTMNT